MRLPDADIKLLPDHIQEQIRRKVDQLPKAKKVNKEAIGFHSAEVVTAIR